MDKPEKEPSRENPYQAPSAEIRDWIRKRETTPFWMHVVKALMLLLAVPVALFVLFVLFFATCSVLAV